MSGFAESGGPFPYMTDSLTRVAFTPAPAGEMGFNRDGWTADIVDWTDPRMLAERRRLNPATGPRLLQGRGRARGPLIGGCADTLQQLKETEWWPPTERWRGAILFYETSEEAPPPETVAAWLGDFAARGILQVLSGILVGRPGGPIDPARHAEYDAAILAALGAAGMPTLPVLAGLDFGHTDPICTIPYGVRAEIDCGLATWRILESAVA
jgi:muramoyltetrapeptide carboxypeptidase LdcA involved in peptidoglycan recycling